MELFWIILIVAFCILMVSLIITTKKINTLKKENDRLKDMIMKFESGAHNKEHKLQEYQSIIDKIKTRYQDSKDAENN